MSRLEKPIETLAGFPDKLKAFGESAVENIQADTSSYSAPQTGYPAPQATYSAPNNYFNLRKTDTDYENNFGTRMDSENEVDYIDLSQIKKEELVDYYNLPRSMQVNKIETALQNILKQLEGAIKITRN